MRIFEWKKVVCLTLLGFSVGSVLAFADDDGKDNPPAKPATTNIEAPAPLTARERMLLDRVEQLERRVADLEGKTNATTVSGADADAAVGAETNAKRLSRRRRPSKTCTMRNHRSTNSALPNRNLPSAQAMLANSHPNHRASWGRLNIAPKSCSTTLRGSLGSILISEYNRVLANMAALRAT